jgi:hypothetical protein
MVGATANAGRVRFPARNFFSVFFYLSGVKNMPAKFWIFSNGKQNGITRYEFPTIAKARAAAAAMDGVSFAVMTEADESPFNRLVEYAPGNGYPNLE